MELEDLEQLGFTPREPLAERNYNPPPAFHRRDGDPISCVIAEIGKANLPRRWRKVTDRSKAGRQDLGL